MTTTSMNVSLPSSMREFIDAQLQVGGYSSASEYVRELVRTDQIKKAETQLRDMIFEGVNSGPGIDARDFFTELKSRLKAQI